MRFRLFCFFAFFILLLPLVGSSSNGSGMSCACSGSPEEADLLTSGGEVAVSETYSLTRTRMGTSFETTASLTSIYEANGMLGHFLSEGRTASDHYVAYQGLSRRVVGDLTPEIVEETALIYEEK